MLALDEEDAAKSARSFLDYKYVPIGTKEDGSLDVAQYQWCLKSVKNAEMKDGRKLLDVKIKHPDVSGQPKTPQETARIDKERVSVRKAAQERYDLNIIRKLGHGTNRIAKDRDQKIIPYFYFWADCTPERLRELIRQLKPWGIQVYAYPRNDHLRKLDARAYVGFWVGPGAGQSMQRIYDFSVPGGKIRVIRQVLITEQQYWPLMRHTGMPITATDR